MQSGRNIIIIAIPIDCTKYTSKRRIFRTIFGCSHERDCDARQATAIIERIHAYTGNAIGDRNVRQTCAIRERTIADARQLAVFAECNARKSRAITECIIADASYAIGNRDALNATAMIERILADACATCNHHGLQRGGRITIVPIERKCTKNVSKIRIFRTIFGCSHKWNRDARKATATFECTRADASHAIGNHNVRQACAI